MKASCRAREADGGVGRGPLFNDAERLSQDPTFRLISSERIWERGRRPLGADRIGRGDGRANRTKEAGGDVGVYAKSVEMRRFRVPTYSEERELASFRFAEVARAGKYEKSGSDGGGLIYNR